MSPDNRRIDESRAFTAVFVGYILLPTTLSASQVSGPECCYRHKSSKGTFVSFNCWPFGLLPTIVLPSMTDSSPHDEAFGKLRLRKQIDENGTLQSTKADESAQEKVRRMNQEAQNASSDTPRRTYGRTPDGKSRSAPL